MKLWAVYTQFYPTYKYEPTLETLCSTKELALIEADKHMRMDFVWIETINVDGDLKQDNDEYVIVKKL